MEKNESLMKTEEQTPRYPAFVEVEKMLEKMAALTQETAARAYDFFLDRGNRFTSQAEDWLRAEMETLRAAPAKITEDKEMVHVMIAAPGFRPDEIEMTIQDNILIVSGEKSEEKESDEENTVYNEWRSDRFLRQFTLPSRVETKDIKAVMKDGILTLNLKKEAAAEIARVAVQAG